VVYNLAIGPGASGVGKTQLAAEYVCRSGGDYDLILWIPADRPASASALVPPGARQAALDRVRPSAISVSECTVAATWRATTATSGATARKAVQEVWCQEEPIGRRAANRYAATWSAHDTYSAKWKDVQCPDPQRPR
jgi:hypothetical protein